MRGSGSWLHLVRVRPSPLILLPWFKLGLEVSCKLMPMNWKFPKSVVRTHAIKILIFPCLPTDLFAMLSIWRGHRLTSITLCQTLVSLLDLSRGMNFQVVTEVKLFTLEWSWSDIYLKYFKESNSKNFK